jgi:hypothetical protein
MTYDAGEPSEINVKLDAYNQKRALQLAEAKAYASLGVQIVKLKTRTLAKLGAYAIRLGLKEVAHGKFVFGGGKAEDTILEIDGIIKELREAAPPCSPDTIITLLQAKTQLIRLVLESGEMHLRAERTATNDGKTPYLQPAFPSGVSVQVGISNHQPTPAPAQIEDVTPKG